MTGFQKAIDTALGGVSSAADKVKLGRTAVLTGSDLWKLLIIERMNNIKEKYAGMEDKEDKWKI